jgi:NADPH-dependent 2,4-dienoyl-CoA reductase/sulfur reductase-like enzyme
VDQSARDIPVASEVDVVVVGGTTGAIAAACEAANAGAKVFLVAPYPYLGEDMTATLRLYLEPGEAPDRPLARQIFLPADPKALRREGNRLGFTYKVDQGAVKIHRDTNPPSILNNGQFGDGVRDSVQFEHNTEIVADLGT